MNLPLQITNKKKYLEERKSIYLEKNQFHYFLLVTALSKNWQTIMVTTFLIKKAVDKIKTSQTIHMYYNNNKKEL